MERNKFKTVELPAMVVRWLAELAEEYLYERDMEGVPPGEQAVIDGVVEASRVRRPVYSEKAKAVWAEWSASVPQGMTWAAYCGVVRTLERCKAGAGMGPGELLDLEALELLAAKDAGEVM